jgi:uncharacterized Zn-binding protein involved in type VI secretion
MPPAARMTDQVLQTGPHCHKPIHPGPPPVAIPHPPMPLPIISGSTTTMIGGLAAARVSDKTQPCAVIPCVPGGPGVIAKGSSTVMIDNLPAARMGDPTTHAVCGAGAIPGPQGKIMPPCCPTVMIGG